MYELLYSKIRNSKSILIYGYYFECKNITATLFSYIFYLAISGESYIRKVTLNNKRGHHIIIYLSMHHNITYGNSAPYGKMKSFLLKFRPTNGARKRHFRKQHRFGDSRKNVSVAKERIERRRIDL